MASLARPGGNVTGVAYAAEGSLVPKRLQILKQMVPMAKRIGALDDGGPESRHRFKEAEAVARTLDVRALMVDARPGRYEQAFADMKAQRADAVYAGGSPIHNQDRKQLIALAARYRLPAIWEWRQHVEEGGLISYGANISALDRRVAIYIDRVLKGANPAELPVEQPTEFELVINLKTAKTLGLTIRPSLLARADKVIRVMDRRAFLAGAAALLAAPLAAEAQPAGKVYRIGVLEVVGMASNAANLSAFRQGLAEHGYVEGQNLVIEYRSADDRPERLSDLATELVRLKIDVIVTRGTPATLAAKQATRTIPIVMMSSGDPVVEHIVASMARPRGNVTGLHIHRPA